MPNRVQDVAPFAGHSPEQERPLEGYAALMTVFSTLAGGFAVWFRASRRELPARVDVRDLVLLTVASHKAARMISKDRVASTIRAPFTRFEADDGPGEVREFPRGRGLRRAFGELIVCPYCIGVWISAGLTAGLLVAPRLTRWLATVLVIVFGADNLQIAYKKAENALSD